MASVAFFSNTFCRFKICSLVMRTGSHLVTKLDNTLYYYRMNSKLKKIESYYFPPTIFNISISTIQVFSTSDLPIAQGIENTRKEFFYFHQFFF